MHDIGITERPETKHLTKNMKKNNLRNIILFIFNLSNNFFMNCLGT